MCLWRDCYQRKFLRHCLAVPVRWVKFNKVYLNKKLWDRTTFPTEFGSECHTTTCIQVVFIARGKEAQWHTKVAWMDEVQIWLLWALCDLLAACDQMKLQPCDWLRLSDLWQEYSLKLVDTLVICCYFTVCFRGKPLWAKVYHWTPKTDRLHLSA